MTSVYRDRNERIFLRIIKARQEGSYYPFADYTCAECSNANVCEYAFDAYNTNGDCLEDK